jgi:alanine dehydrogenase
MLIGVPKEIKDNEFRVGMTPAVVAELVHHGHSVLVETSAGVGSGLTDDEYRAAGATIVGKPAEIFARAEMIVKVKEPQADERKMLRSGQVLFTYLHLAPDLPQTEDLIKSGAVCIAYETVTSATGGLPLLAPMSEVAGRLAPQVGAHALEKAAGGRGILLGGVPGAPAADVLIIGGGVSGTHAATIALGMGAHVTILDRSLEALRRLSDHFEGRIQTIFSTRAAIREWVMKADLIIGAVLVPGASAPKLITREMLGTMKQGAVLVDIAIDQGGCAETSKPTTHSDPTYVVDGVSTIALPTCRARWREPRPSRSTTPRCRSRWRSRTRDGARRLARIRICAPVSMSAPDSSPASRSRQLMACLTGRQNRC